MTTKELIDWANKAEELREQSWTGQGYDYSMSLAALKSQPKGATDTERDIVTCLLHTCWNEVQDWKATFEKESK